MKQASVLLATARAHKVLPVPGGPYSKTPLGGSMPRLTKRSGWRRGVSTTCDRSSKKGGGGSLRPLSASQSAPCNLQRHYMSHLASPQPIDMYVLTYPFWASDLHHSDCRVDLWRQGNVDLVPGKVSSVNCISWSSIMLVCLVTNTPLSEKLCHFQSRIFSKVSKKKLIYFRSNFIFFRSMISASFFRSKIWGHYALGY